jgi:hypothetical protein
MQETLSVRLGRQVTTVRVLAGVALLACGCAGTLADPGEFEDGGGSSGSGSSGSGTAGSSGTATTGSSGTATTGSSGTATTGSSGTATTGSSGTATTGSSGTATSGTAASDCTGPLANIPTFLATTCGSLPTCHAMGGSGVVDLASAGVAMRLVGVKSLFDSPNLLINPTTPAQSVVLLVLDPTNFPPGVGQMPLGGPYLTPAQIACVQSWVDAQH